MRKILRNLSSSVELFLRRIFTREGEARWRDVLSRLDSIENILCLTNDVRTIPLATGDLRLLQLADAKFLREIAEVLTKNGIQYWISSGTLLGAVRHKGFIPWDDDIDICAIRKDYEKIEEVLRNEYGENGAVFTVTADCLRVFKRGTPCQIDIFAWDILELPDDSPMTLQKAELIHRSLNSKIAYDFNRLRRYERTITTHSNEEIANMARVLTGAFTGPIKILCEGIEECHRNFFHWKYEMVFPLREIEFEGCKFSCPNDVNSYLSVIYGDFMAFPKGIHAHTGIRLRITPEARENMRKIVGDGV